MTPIRPANPNDANQIANVHVRCWQEAYRGIIPDDYLSSLKTEPREAMWTRALNADKSVFVATDNGEIIGFANGGNNKKQDGYQGELFTCYLLQAYHHKGIGSKLFDAVKADLEERKLLPFTTWVLANNPACRFYEAKGGKVIEERMDNIGGADLKELCYGWGEN